MKKVRICFYKNSKTFFWKLIRLKQKFIWIPGKYAKYSHVEIQFGNVCISSSEVDGWVRVKEIFLNPKNWDVIEMEISDEDYKKMILFAMQEMWNNYNWLWIFFAQILNMNFKWNHDWFCSEFVSRVLQEKCMLCAYSSLFISPGRLAFILENNYWFNIKNIKWKEMKLNTDILDQ